jgi:adapter protein MecA 1/2
MEPDEMEDKPLQDVVSVLAEYGEPTSYTKAVMEEYGQVIIAADAVSVLCTHFS